MTFELLLTPARTLCFVYGLWFVCWSACNQSLHILVGIVIRGGQDRAIAINTYRRFRIEFARGVVYEICKLTDIETYIEKDRDTDTLIATIN